MAFRVNRRKSFAAALTISSLAAGVLIANAPPEVAAGIDDTATVAIARSLDGSCSDDGLPAGSLTCGWTQTVGTGCASSIASVGAGSFTCVDDSSPDFSITCTLEETATLELCCSDGIASTCDDKTRAVSTLPPKPDATNTGPSGTLTPTSSVQVHTNGTTLQDLDINGTLYINADNVTVRNTRVSFTSGLVGTYAILVEVGHSGILLEDIEIEGDVNGINGYDSAGLFGCGFTARRIEIHNIRGDGMKVQGSNCGPTVVEYSYVHSVGITTSPDPHTDANQSRGAFNTTFRYNNFDMPVPGTPGYPNDGSNASSVVFFELYTENVLVDSNWMNGGTYSVGCPCVAAQQNCAIAGDGSTITFSNNRFGRDYQFGVFPGSQGTCTFDSSNVWDDDGLPVIP